MGCWDGEGAATLLGGVYGGDPGQHLVAGFAGHLHVEQDEVGEIFAALNDMESLIAVHGRCDNEAKGAQEAFNDELQGARCSGRAELIQQTGNFNFLT